MGGWAVCGWVVWWCVVVSVVCVWRLCVWLIVLCGKHSEECGCICDVVLSSTAQHDDLTRQHKNTVKG